MPGKDRTRPEGLGSRAGRQLGKCSSHKETPPQERSSMGRGMGREVGRAAGRAAKSGAGKGMGLGWGHQAGRC